MHTWQTALRGLAANWTLLEYLSRTCTPAWPRCSSPQDLHIATLVGALNQLNCGTTTLADWCHNNPTPAHNDAAVDGLLQSGIRAAYFHGTPKPDPQAWSSGLFGKCRTPALKLSACSKPTRASRCCSSVHDGGAGAALLNHGRGDARLRHGARNWGMIASLHQGGGPARTPGRLAKAWSRRASAGRRTSTSCTAMRWTTCSSSAFASWA